jgi:hypothetical protein
MVAVGHFMRDSLSLEDTAKEVELITRGVNAEEYTKAFEEDKPTRKLARKTRVYIFNTSKAFYLQLAPKEDNS